MLTTAAAETRTVVDYVRWETYVALADDRREHLPRITYDRGLMELMSPKKEHEKVKTLLGRLVAAYAEAMEIDMESVASTTFRREDLERGFEADEAFYLRHAEAMRSKLEIDLTVDPAPELVIEIEMTSSAIRKLDLFAALGVAEVWRHDGESLSVFTLTGESYSAATTSSVLPGFPITQATAVIAERHTTSEIKLIKTFRESIGSAH